MRSKLTTIDKILDITVNMCYPYEGIFYNQELFENSGQVIDMGCGNGAYLNLLSKDYKDKTFTGIEINKGLAMLAKDKCSEKNVIIRNSSFEDIEENFSFDFIIARRFVLTLAENRSKFFKWLKKTAPSDASILIIDTDIDGFMQNSSLPLFFDFYKSIVKDKFASDKISIETEIEEVMKNEGFKKLSTKHTILNTNLDGIKTNLYTYMRLVAELHLGENLPEELDNELFNWLISSSTYAEFKLFGLLYSLD